MQSFMRLARQAGKARSQLLALSGASVAAAYYGLGTEQDAAVGGSQFRLPSLIPVALADAPSENARAKSAPAARIALTGFEGVKDAAEFVATALQKALKVQKNSPLQQLLARGEGAAPSTDPAEFYSALAAQPLAKKIVILDDIVDAVIKEAERSAEVSGLTVGMLGGGVACYALLGWWSDMALPGAGTLACSAVAGAAGHQRAKAAAKRTRTRLLSALLSAETSASAPNAFVSYLAAPSLADKQAVASATAPAAFFADFHAAVAPLLRQVSGANTSEENAVMSTAA